MRASSLRAARWAAAGVAVVLLTGCSPSDGPGPDEPSESSSSSSPSPSDSDSGGQQDFTAQQVRRSLAVLDPCALLTPPDGGQASNAYPVGPHTCNGRLAGTRVTIEVGVPFDEAARESAQPQSIAGLAAYRRTEGCSMVFAAAESHGIAVDLTDAGCASLPRAAEAVGATLSEGIETATRPSGPDQYTACELLAEAVDDPSTLTDREGTAGGLDHCEAGNQPVSARDSLRLTYTSVPFDRLARELGGTSAHVAGHDFVVVDEGQRGCYVHTYLWQTRTAERGTVDTEATLFARDCDRARSLIAAVVQATVGNVPDAVDPADVLVQTR